MLSLVTNSAFDSMHPTNSGLPPLPRAPRKPPAPSGYLQAYPDPYSPHDSGEVDLSRFAHIPTEAVQAYYSRIQAGEPRVQIERIVLHDVSSNGKAINALILDRLGHDISSPSPQTIRLQAADTEVRRLQAWVNELETALSDAWDEIDSQIPTQNP